MIAGGILLLLVVTAAIGNRDKSGEKVPPPSWAQSVCGAVGTWRGEMESIVNEIRTPPATGESGTEEPQSQTPQGREALVREGLKNSVRATKTLVEGIDNAGTADTAKGAEADQLLSHWAATSRTTLEHAQQTLEQEATTLEVALAQFAGAATAIRATLVTGVHTLSQVAALDTTLASAFHDSSTCQQLREEQSAS
jgi:hypothetical protein